MQQSPPVDKSGFLVVEDPNVLAVSYPCIPVGRYLASVIQKQGVM